MSSVLRFVPGLIAAVVAFIALKLLFWFGFAALIYEILVFVLVYIAVVVVVDRAMTAYGSPRK